ncbi:uncharacterized protein BJ212DRAFT_1478697 [Suillus subaureus]|uniref:Uncharacterized protein n=1 Tax=Suillus subaureus TaxID=48587 RepID=A0A9P7EG53_9AGAM|nr:uncharacterized protein BJ212DRAFT_1478697 [Suillus subaureus]KAG1820596.1 hypothetical protein BJ212DRAFT_1478697 [Suillus subaureus]
MKAKLQDANDGLKKGERIKLTKFITENKASLLCAYGWLTVAKKQAHNAQVLQAHQEKRSAARANPKAIWHDMNAAFTSMDHEWTALCAHMGMQGFYIAVHGVGNEIPPGIYCPHFDLQRLVQCMTH